MALTLKLVRDSTELDLQGGAVGLQLLDAGWLPKVAGESPGRPTAPVTESLRLRALGTSHDNLATYVQALATFQRQAAEYAFDPSACHPVWLYAQLLHETVQRRAAVRSIGWEFMSGWFEGAASAASRQQLAVAVERAPLWEPVAVVNLATQSPSAQVAVLYDPTASADILGDAPGRMTLSLTNLSAGVTLDRAWIGLRSTAKYGTAANFKFIWECEVGTMGVGATTTLDATASNTEGLGVSMATVTATSGWSKRVTIRMDQAVDIGTYSDLRQQFGLSVWLLRMKAQTGATWEVQLRFGYDGMADANFVTLQTVQVTGTSWDFYNMGVQAIPPRDAHVSLAFTPSVMEEAYTTVQIWARPTGGATGIDLDCLVRIPVDEGFLFLQSPVAIGQTELVTFRETEFGKTGVASINSSSHVKAFPPYEAGPFRVLPGDVRMVVAVARSASQVITDAVQLSGSYYPAYRSLAGAG